MHAMEIQELTHDERLALIALLQLVVGSDGAVSPAERQQLGRVAAALGAEEYDRLADEANARFPDEDTLKVCLLAIGRQDARELIYGQVIEAAIQEGVNAAESELLDWLGKTWRIRVEVLDGQGDR